MRRRHLFLCGFVALAACHKSAAPGSDDAAPNDGAAIPSDSAKAGNSGFVLYPSMSVRRSPSDDKDVEDPNRKGKRLSNWLQVLYRGEQVSILDNKDDWTHIRTSDEKEGWVKTSQLLLLTGVEMATVSDKVKTFGRPDLLALSPNRLIDAGTLLFVLRSKDQFSEVNVTGSSSAWVLSDTLLKDPHEVEASKLLNKAHWLQDHNDAGAAQGLLDLARSQFETTKLVQTLLARRHRPQLPEVCRRLTRTPPPRRPRWRPRYPQATHRRPQHPRRNQRLVFSWNRQLLPRRSRLKRIQVATSICTWT